MGGMGGEERWVIHSCASERRERECLGGRGRTTHPSSRWVCIALAEAQLGWRRLVCVSFITMIAGGEAREERRGQARTRGGWRASGAVYHIRPRESEPV